MAFDAAALGFLAPTSPPPDYDDALTDILGASVAGITGLPRKSVRPRWVPDPAAQPARPENWCAVGVTSVTPDSNASTVHDGRGDGSDTEYRGEELSVLASFYGPLASGYASYLRDGLMVQANRAALMRAGLAYGRAGTLRNVSGLVNTENLNRYDFDFVLRRRVARTYAVPNIRSVSGGILSPNGSPIGAQLGITPISVK